MHTAQLIVYRFGPNAGFEGQLVGALERIEAGGAVKIADALFVARDPETGELVAIDLQSDGAGGIVEPLLRFRLEPRERRRATERALSPDGGSVTPETLRRLEAQLEPGETIVAVLLEHAWAGALNDAVTRTGGATVANEFVDSATLADLAPDLIAAASRSGASTP